MRRLFTPWLWFWDKPPLLRSILHGLVVATLMAPTLFSGPAIRQVPLFVIATALFTFVFYGARVVTGQRTPNQSDNRDDAGDQGSEPGHG